MRRFAQIALLASGCALASAALAFDNGQYENVPADIRAALTQRGHQIRLLEPFSFSVGQGAAVVRDSSRQVNFAAGDPRSDGAAIPQEPSTK